MTVKLMDNKAIWDRFIDDSPYGSLFHKWDFLDIVEKHSGYKLLRYGVYRSEELVCLFPLFIKKYLGVTMVFSPPPGMAVPHLGFVMTAVYDKLKQRRKEAYINDVMDEMEGELKRLSANYVSITTPTKFLDIRPFKWNGYKVHMYYTYVVDLNRPLEEIWGDFEKDLKREIRNSDKEQFSIRPADDLETFYNIMRDRYSQQKMNVPIASKEYLRDILAAFPDNVKLEFLYNGDKLVDLIAYYEYKKRFVFWIGWVNLDKSVHSNEYLAWEYIKRKKAEGMQVLEIQGANVKRLCLFKSKFNAALEYGFMINRKDVVGNIAESTYRNFIKKRWI